ncbi:MAG: tyrosine-type recombinase/integrase [Burkholderiales bacterium]
MLLDEYGVEVLGPLERWAPKFASGLASLGYVWPSIHRALSVFAFVSDWLGTRRLRPRDVTAEQAELLRRARRSDDYRRSLTKVLQFLRGAGGVPTVRPSTQRTGLDRLLDRYREYLTDERGLSDGVVRWYGTVAGRLLKGCERNADFRRLSADQVREFLRKEAHGFSPRQAGYVATALRSVLRFMYTKRLTPASLVGAVPSIAGWRGASLPQAVTSGAVRKLLCGCDRRTLIGRRDHAIMLLLARLGLRAGEVARLELEALDWRAGEVVVHGKGKSLSRLPLPQDVGQALSVYLTRRPRADSRAVFLRSRAPLRPLTQTGITHVVAKASKRAEFARLSPHKLRHALATEMLRRGATLAQIAQVLRHRSVTTTALYAKVDRTALRELAQPWPGGVA